MADNGSTAQSSSGQNTGAKPKNNTWRPYWMKKRQNLPQSKPVIILLPTTTQNHTALSTNVSNLPSTSTIFPSGQFQYHSFILDKISPNEPYPSWKLYFSGEKYSADSPIVKNIKTFEKHFKDFPEKYNVLKIYSDHYFNISINDLKRDATFQNSWNYFYQELIQTPDIVLSAAGMAMHTLCVKCPEIQNEINNCQKLMRKRTSFKIFRPRIQDFIPVEDLASIRSKNYDTLMSIRATVVQTGETSLISTWSTYECLICNGQQIVKQDDGVVIQPNSCKKTGCTNRSKFKFLMNSPYNRLEKFQTIRVQQLITRGKHGDETKQIKHIEIELLNDLVDKVAPGEDVILTGILRIRPLQENSFYHDEGLKFYLEGITLIKEKSYQNVTAFSEKDLEAVRMIKEEPSPFKLLVQSLCPAIFGHEMVKAGLVLSLLGGCGNKNKIRPEIHVLMVGDPGVGKSEMLRACSQLSSKEVFVSGCGSSVAGLTVCITNRKNGGEIEGGALVLADGAHCCIDEFDKTRSNQHAVLEVMEQQTIGIAKAGVYCTIPARTSILAAANPESGHYDRSKSVLENIKMGTPLLSRFDLIFIMIDKADENFDNMLTEHVQGYLSGNKKAPTANSFRSYNNRNISSIFQENNENHNDLESRLRFKTGEDVDLLPPVLIRRYIAYARKNCNPEITDEAGEALQQFYLELRQTTIDSNLIPITPRQFEGLIRLTQARARADLSDVATISHAMDVISIFRYSMKDVFTTEINSLDIDLNISRSNRSGSSKSLASQIKQFLTLLLQASKNLDKRIFDESELKEIASLKGLEDNITNLIDSLNNQGYLLKKSANTYKLVSC